MDVKIGCASFKGADPRQLAIPLSFLHHHARAPHAWCAKDLPDRSASMDLLPKQMINPKEALRALPPLIKGHRSLRASGEPTRRVTSSTSVVHARDRIIPCW